MVVVDTRTLYDIHFFLDVSREGEIQMFVNARAIIERNTNIGKEVLLQVINKPNEPKALEFPGGRLEEFESIKEALLREVFEETGLKVKTILHDTTRRVYTRKNASIEGLNPFFVYQTIKGPVDSIGFIFRCSLEENQFSQNEESYGHQWVPIKDIETRFRDNPEVFDWLTQGIIDYYLAWRKRNE
jgi:8-oxo-dGTP diphosphatase